MEELARNFRRKEDGSWTCVSAATFQGPNGRIQVAAGSTFHPGTEFMGVDLAQWLEDRLRGRAGDCG